MKIFGAHHHPSSQRSITKERARAHSLRQPPKLAQQLILQLPTPVKMRAHAGGGWGVRWWGLRVLPILLKTLLLFVKICGDGRENARGVRGGVGRCARGSGALPMIHFGCPWGSATWAPSMSIHFYRGGSGGGSCKISCSANLGGWRAPNLQFYHVCLFFGCIKVG